MPRARLILVLIVALTLPTLITWIYFDLLAAAPASIQQSAYGAGKTLQFVLPIVWVLGVERRKLDLRKWGGAGMVQGLAFGLLIFVATLVLYQCVLEQAGWFASAAEAVHAKVAAFGIDRPWKYFLLAGFYSLVHAGLEEYYWRWFVFGELRRVMAWKLAVAVSSLGFMAHHVLVLSAYFGTGSPATVLFSLAVAVGGAYWAWLFHRSGSLDGPWLGHVFVDAAIFAVGYDLVGPMG